MANFLSMARRVAALHAFCEGAGVKPVARMQRVSPQTLIQLLRNVGRACSAYQDEHLRNLPIDTIQCDEMWSFIHTRRQNLEEDDSRYGDAWLWTALDPKSKLLVSWRVGPRVQRVADTFMADLAQRIRGTMEIVTDGHRVYVNAIDKLDRPKLCGHRPIIGRYVLTRKSNVTTNHVERLNLTLRTSVRRLARRTNGFSKTMSSHVAAIGLWSMYYNFGRINSSIRVTPAMEAGLANHVWSIEEILNTVKVNYQWRPDPDGDDDDRITRPNESEREQYCECCGQLLTELTATFDGRFCSRVCKTKEQDHKDDRQRPLRTSVEKSESQRLRWEKWRTEQGKKEVAS